MKNALLIALLALGLQANGQNTWTIDPSHSEVKFEITHMVISTVSGNFKTFSIVLGGNPTEKDFSKATVTASIEVKSINTNNEMRDGHLQGADFFDAPNHPEIKFVSTSFVKLNDNEYEINGNLTIRETTKPVTFKTIYHGAMKDQKGKVHVGFQSTLVINRFDYGLKWSAAVETGGLVAGKDVTITVNTEVVQQTEKNP